MKGIWLPSPIRKNRGVALEGSAREGGEDLTGGPGKRALEEQLGRERVTELAGRFLGAERAGRFLGAERAERGVLADDKPVDGVRLEVLWPQTAKDLAAVVGRINPTFQGGGRTHHQPLSIV